MKKDPELKKKVLLIVPLPPPVHGASYLSSIIYNSLKHRSFFELSLIHLKFTDNLRDLGKFSLSKVFRGLFLGFSILKRVVCFKPDLVYYAITSEGFSFYRDCIYLKLLKILRIKVVIQHFGKLPDKSLVKKRNMNMMRNALKGRYSLILSDNLRVNIAPYTDIDNVKVIPVGIPDTESFLRRSRSETEVLQILFLSTMSENKGVYVLLSALSLLKERNIRFRAVFAGKFSRFLSRESFEAKVNSSGLGENVRCMGEVTDKEKRELYRDSDLFVFPTKRESYGIVAIEASRSGLPVIATDEGSLPFIVKNGESGLLFRNSDYTDLADKIERIFSDNDLRKRMGGSARARFLEFFVFDNTMDLLTDFLREKAG